MLLRDVMTRDVKVIQKDTTLKEAAEHMKSLDIGALPVCEGKRLIAMLTDRDITVRATAMGADPNNTKVSDVLATSDVIVCYEDDDVRHGATVMKDHQIRRLPIVNRRKELVGIVSLGDLAVDTEKNRMVGRALEGISQPSR